MITGSNLSIPHFRNWLLKLHHHYLPGLPSRKRIYSLEEMYSIRLFLFGSLQIAVYAREIEIRMWFCTCINLFYSVAISYPREERNEMGWKVKGKGTNPAPAPPSPDHPIPFHPKPTHLTPFPHLPSSNEQGKCMKWNELTFISMSGCSFPYFPIRISYIF